MGKYDLHSPLTDDCKLNFKDLIVELMDEYPISDSYDTYYNKFKNHDKSGLIDKLNYFLDFDIEKIAENSTTAKFEMFKLLKLLFYIEKYGEPRKNKGFKDCQKIKIPIIKILSQPRLSNINISYSCKSEYGDVFDKLFEDIKSVVDDAEKRIQEINNIDLSWECIIEKQYQHVIDNKALMYPAESLEELQRIRIFLEDKILKKLDELSSQTKSESEGVFKTFFNIMLTHKKLCYEHDRIEINYSIDLSEKPDDKYVQLFLENENYVINKELLKLIEKSFRSPVEDEKVYIIRRFLSYFKEIPQCDYKHYKYAFMKLDKVANWLLRDKPGLNFSEGIPFEGFVTIIQEIVYVKKNVENNKLHIDGVGKKPLDKTLLSVLKNEDSSSSIFIKAWLKRIENRFCINFGSWELIEEMRKIELAIFEIKSFIYRFRNINDLVFVNKLLVDFVVSSTFISQKFAQSLCNRFNNAIIGILREKGVNIEKVIFPSEAINCFNLFREILLTKDVDYTLSNVATQVACGIVNSIRVMTKDIYHINININIRISNEKKQIKNGLLSIDIILPNNELKYRQFYMIESDEIVERYCSLGLENIFKKNDVLLKEKE